ncbi:hypothetical protein EDF38_1822 [Frigoribacterium sp. PhB160]|uniref:hypothetical protein n=1 Tax=Frigoribacterium sp. PhB160 TaxID=2485192 RepID=UPI000FABD3E1|nr:hypothetical protein [Frigoribacterium sp. PhB160]ROS58982.1 hypothetical protein EDF38_1822 [Frigoribacterium sp. PhB160]
MIRLRRRLGLDALRDDSGMAMAMALIFGMVLVVMAATALTVATSGLKKADTDQDWNGALSAAYAGIEEYQSRLANDNSYFKYGNDDAPFTKATASKAAGSTIDTASLILPTGDQANKAFGIGATGTWATVPGSAGTSQYRYEVDRSLYASKGTLTIRATGKVGSSTRSVVADLRQKGFIDYLYFTDFEFKDPMLSGRSVTNCNAVSSKHAWEGRVTGDNCGEIAFGSGDKIYGPAHSNDTLRVCDATFFEAVTTAKPDKTPLTYTRQSSTGAGCTGQDFKKGDPVGVGTIGMPDTNEDQRRETRNDLTSSDVPLPGCLYTGPTDIVFTDDGKMTVKSPYTKATRTKGDAKTATEGSALADCGIPGQAAGQLGSAGGATIPVPANNLIYVQNIPLPSLLGKSNVNATAAIGDMTDTSCGNNHVGYPVSGEVAPAGGSSASRYDAGATGDGTCAYSARAGDAFVKGTFRGQLTIATENYLYVTGDLKYSTTDATTNILGLAPTSTLWVWNPMSSSNKPLLTAQNREINGSVLSLRHSFTIQNVGKGGERGTLTVKGSIAQAYRGIVHSGDNGYIKNYTYDTRLRYMAPPKFLSPVTTSYGVTTLSEVKAGYKPDGSTAP